MKPIYLIFIISFVFNLAFCQEHQNFQIVINEIGELENYRDPKCHATASRLEDFMYGTPLTPKARNARIDFQKDFIRRIWLTYSRKLDKNKTEDPALFKAITSEVFTFSNNEKEDILIHFKNGENITVKHNDYRQYSSVAYALRAILSVEQSFLFEEESLASLNENAIEYFKKVIDLAVLATLQKADQISRENNQNQITEEHFNQAVNSLFNELKHESSLTKEPKDVASQQAVILKEIIDKKLASYDQYNKINQSVFLRNVQVYFSRIPWPEDPKLSDSLKIFYTETMVQFSKDLLLMSQSNALKSNEKIIQYSHAFDAVQLYLPHVITNLEDVIFFPKFSNSEQLYIEAYDFDAFRDSGWHWQYLLSALKDDNMQLGLAPDPFALEMIVEGIAQFAVLLFRVGGEDAHHKGQEYLTKANLENGIQLLQSKITKHASYNSERSDNASIISSPKIELDSKVPFKEVEHGLGIDFIHKSSDWLSRLIRGYIIKEDEGLARLSIPPAFSGSGIASEDINNDGWLDVLILSGSGNKLYLNENGESFVDITDSSKIDWAYPDGTKAEPRQPIIADFDNDGLQDIFISYANENHRMYRNVGQLTFEDLTSTSNFGGAELVGGSATAFDYNNDGLLDIYIGYFGNYINGELPTLSRTNTNGGKNQLFENLGNFKFKDVTDESGTGNLGWTQVVSHSDINGDGYQDIIVGNDFGTNAYYINQKDGTFLDKSKELGTDKPSFTMGIGISDLNKDLIPDYYISNIVVMEKDDKYVLPNQETTQHFNINSLSNMRVVEANDLFISYKMDSLIPHYVLSDQIGRGFSSTGWSWDADFFDFDNDGDDDIYCLTGMNPYNIYGEGSDYYGTDSNKDKKLMFAQSHGDENILFSNNEGKLSIVEKSGGLNYNGTSRSAVYLDIDNDGDLDILTNEYHGKSKLFINQLKPKNTNWIKIKLESLNNETNRDAIGSKIIVRTPDGNIQYKQLSSTTGYLSSHPKTLHFGLGRNNECELKIIWPNGLEESLTIINVNQTLKITQ